MSDQNLVVILGDQLSTHLSALRHADRSKDIVIMAEISNEADYVPHHRKKLVFIFSAMRHFAQELEAHGWTVDYTYLGHYDNFEDWFIAKVKTYDPQKVITTDASEWRVLEMQKQWEKRVEKPVDKLADDRFISTCSQFVTWANARKQLRMEYFYRMMRQETKLLMDGDKPVGGQWNFDHENRKPARADFFMKGPLKFTPDEITRTVLGEVVENYPDRYGALDDYWFAATKEQAEAALKHFIEHSLPHFGDYQDALLSGEPFLYHSVIAQYINIGFLDPLEVCQKVEQAYYDQKAPINAAEGFIRQILGWREYVRGIYWLKMPEYLEENYFEADQDLPSFYWDADTDMACLNAALSQTRDHAYAHHIQRLMITGNFAMLIGVDPKQVHEWYLAVYADAYEWVELPNTLGMSQFADGGLLGSKPYAAGGNYINKMSDYCQNCRYQVKERTGENACPFNALYWEFLVRNREKLANNPRLGPVYRTWSKMDEKKQIETRKQAQEFINSLYD